VAYKPIENYGVIGDLHTVALVGVDGSIDWCCLPHFDSPSVFATLLDNTSGGYFKISPIAADARKQLYVPDTNVLVTRFFNSDGISEVIDFMPIEACGLRGGEKAHAHQIIRRVVAVSGAVQFRLQCFPAFNYARDPHEIQLHSQGVLFASRSAALGFVTPIEVSIEDTGVVAEFTLNPGQCLTFFLRHMERGDRAELLVTEESGQEAFRHTVDFWRRWLAQCRYAGRSREMVRRSALVLKLLTYAPTGAIVAAPTTSLPEKIGGVRNWDYRYCFIRDASFTLYALMRLGFNGEADQFMGWLEKRCQELKPDDSLQPLYSIEGHWTAPLRLESFHRDLRGARPAVLVF
jgi:GH15 family glucan-1,4-alpha-glucosidase